MTQQKPLHTAPAPGISGPRWMKFDPANAAFGFVFLVLLGIAAFALYHNHFVGTLYPGGDNAIGQQYGVEVLDINQRANPELITVKEPGREPVTCLLPARDELEDRAPLRGCSPADTETTTIPAK